MLKAVESLPRLTSQSASANRRARHAREAARLWRSLLLLADGTPGVVALGADPFIEKLLPLFGLVSSGVANMRVHVDGRIVTVLAVPKRIWKDPNTKPTLHSLKGAARKLGVRVLLVPSDVVRREPRLANARLLARCRQDHVDPADRRRVLNTVRQRPGLHLHLCADVVQHGDPIGVIFRLAVDGDVRIPLSEHICPFTPVFPPRGTGEGIKRPI